ncbi:MAG: hypothetical protein ACRD0R_13610 [Acidimicrobiales bacterium]|jgi:hypothetical protein
MPPTRIPPEDLAYPAHMQAISFPTAAAQAAKTVCDRIAALLNEHLLARPGLVDGARDGWEGGFRAEFDETWRLQEVRLGALKEDLQRLSGDISTALTNVSTINAQRAAQREEYRAQHQTPTGVR